MIFANFISSLVVDQWWVARILLGVGFLFDFLLLLFTPSGSNERSVISYQCYMLEGARSWSIFQYSFFVGKYERIPFMVGVLFSVLLAVNIVPKISILIIVTLIISTNNRFPYLVHAGKTLGLLLLSFLFFAPAGTITPNSVELNFGWPWAITCAKLQVSLMYMGTVYSKMRNADWRDGSMVYKILSHYYLRTTINMPQLFNYVIVIRAVTYGVILIQFICPILLWSSNWRILGLVLLASLHIGLSLFLKLRTFPIYAFAGLSLFLS